MPPSSSKWSCQVIHSHSKETTLAQETEKNFIVSKVRLIPDTGKNNPVNIQWPNCLCRHFLASEIHFQTGDTAKNIQEKCCMQSLVAKIHYTKRFLYNRIPVILQNTYLHSVCIYKKAWFIPEAMVSTQERWCLVRVVRPAPGCGWLWGAGVRWRAAGANVEET